jgi:hypothetical protein
MVTLSAGSSSTAARSSAAADSKASAPRSITPRSRRSAADSRSDQRRRSIHERPQRGRTVVPGTAEYAARSGELEAEPIVMLNRRAGGKDAQGGLVGGDQ